jgi:hypothetical protein
MKEAFISLEKAAREMHLQINQEKTKCMPATKQDCRHSPSHIEIGPYKFETVHSSTYLGSEVNCKNYISAEIKKCILSANRYFHRLRKHFKSHISRKTKMILYKVLIRPVATYASETWTLSKADERALGLFERKILRSIFGAVQDKGQWRRRCNLNDINYTMSQIWLNTLLLTD